MVEQTNTSQITHNDFIQAYEVFKTIVAGLSEKFRRTETSIIKSLLENICDYRVKYLLEQGSNGSNARFDRYFSIKHEFIKNKFVQKLTIALRSHAIKACIATEEKNLVGVFDVIIRINKHHIYVEDSRRSTKIITELKSGESVDLHQIERYLWECDTLLLIRVPINQVIRITHDELQDYLKASLADIMERAAVITDSNLQKIPGYYCRGCPVSSCEFYKPENDRKIIAYNSASMQSDLLLLFNNINTCLDQAVSLILQEVNSNG